MWLTCAYSSEAENKGSEQITSLIIKRNDESTSEHLVMVAASGLLEPLDEKVAREICSLEGSFTHSYPILQFFIFFLNTMAVNQTGKGWLSDSVFRYYTPLITLSQRLSSNSKAFDDEDDEFVLHLAASILLFNTMLLVHMVGINP